VDTEEERNNLRELAGGGIQIVGHKELVREQLGAI